MTAGFRSIVVVATCGPRGRQSQRSEGVAANPFPVIQHWILKIKIWVQHRHDAVMFLYVTIHQVVIFFPWWLYRLMLLYCNLISWPVCMCLTWEEENTEHTWYCAWHDVNLLKNLTGKLDQGYGFQILSIFMYFLSSINPIHTKSSSLGVKKKTCRCISTPLWKAVFISSSLFLWNR